MLRVQGRGQAVVGPVMLRVDRDRAAMVLDRFLRLAQHLQGRADIGQAYRPNWDRASSAVRKCSSASS